jgi:hypothetical protein
MPDNLHEIVGVIHIHSSYSDGTKPIEEIARIGESAGLDFLMFSDHMTLQPLRDGHERFHNKIAVIIGYEIEDKNDENHYLAFGIDRELPAKIPAPDYVSQVHQQGGLGIIAHPDEIRAAIHQYPAYPWNAWDAAGFDAIEIWNHMSAWLENLKKFNVIKMIFHPRRDLRGPTSRVLKKWDELSEIKKVAGIGSADVHAHVYRRGPIRLTIFPYKVQFRSIRTHLLLNEPLSSDIGRAKLQILDTIRSCRVFVSNYRWGDARGFKFYVQCLNKIAIIGDEVPYSDNLILKIMAPLSAELRLINNGATISVFSGDQVEFPIKEPGLYRVELYRNGKGWIYSNHIRIIKE